VASGASLAVTAWGLLRMARFAASRHALPRVSPDTSWPASVTAVVPARDEARNIRRCVAGLCRTGGELVEVVVVDDHSDDDTAALAARAGDARVRVVPAPSLRSGERGKPAACAVGAREARGDWLWFVDADVEVAPDALRRLLACAEESRSSVVSALGRVVAADAGTAWLVPEVGFTLARRLSLAAVADPTAAAAFASGQCLLVRRDVYAELGGHVAVADDAVEDVALARIAAARGIGQRVALAPDAFSVLMYADLGEMWHGLLRSSATVRGTGSAAVVRELMWAGGAVVPLVVAISPGLPRGARRFATAAVAGQVVTSAGGRLVAGAPVWPALAAPLAEVTLVANWVAGVRARRAGDTVRWRSRDVPVG
jgi:hypothetical protein